MTLTEFPKHLSHFLALGASGPEGHASTISKHSVGRYDITEYRTALIINASTHQVIVGTGILRIEFYFLFVFLALISVKFSVVNV